MKLHVRFVRTLGVLVCVGVVLALMAAPTGATPPKGKFYAVILILIDPPDGALDVVPTCLQFTKSEMCTPDGNCGTWEFVGKARHQNEWNASFDFLNEEGLGIHAELRGITERAGTGNSIGGTVLYSVDDFLFNGSFSGTRVSRSECLAFATLEDG